MPGDKEYLKGVDDDLPENQDRSYGLDSCAENEADEGTGGGHQGAAGIFFTPVYLSKKGSEERACDHAYRSEDYTSYKTYHSSPFGIFAAAGELGEVHRNDIVDYGHHEDDHAPDYQGGQGHRKACSIRTGSPYIKYEHSHPAYRSAGKSGKDAAGDSYHAGENCQYYY